MAHPNVNVDTRLALWTKTSSIFYHTFFFFFLSRICVSWRDKELFYVWVYIHMGVCIYLYIYTHQNKLQPITQHFNATLTSLIRPARMFLQTKREMSLSSCCVLFLAFVLLGSVNCAVSLECKIYDERLKTGGRSGTADKKVVCSNMELQQVLPVTSFPNRTVTL